LTGLITVISQIISIVCIRHGREGAEHAGMPRLDHSAVVTDQIDRACLLFVSGWGATGHPFTRSNEVAFRLLMRFVWQMAVACAISCDICALPCREMVTSAIDIAKSLSQYDH